MIGSSRDSDLSLNVLLIYFSTDLVPEDTVPKIIVSLTFALPFWEPTAKMSPLQLKELKMRRNGWDSDLGLIN